jgi:hypothetical protein
MSLQDKGGRKAVSQEYAHLQTDRFKQDTNK